MNTNMVDVKIILSALWVAAMFVWQQGDVQRLYSGDYNNDDSGCYDYPVPDFELSCESLGKHHRRYSLYWL